MEINGVAHAILTVRDMERSRPFYAALLRHMGLVPVIDAPDYLYCVGGRTALGIRPAPAEKREAAFDQDRCGLHHLCFRARSREDVESVHALAARLGARIVRAPEEGAWAPGYYSALFEDPDGIRIEIVHVPGKGLLEPGAAGR